MGDATTIEWTAGPDGPGATWNPVSGCAKVSAGCAHCYAERVFPRVYGKDSVERGQIVTNSRASGRPRRFTDVRLHRERLDSPLHWRRPRRIFVNSMSDLFHEAVPDEFLGEVIGVIATASQHTFQVLTKRPERMREFLQRNAQPGGQLVKPLENVWFGVSVEDQATADQRIPILLDTPTAVRFVSAEPLLSAMDLSKYLPSLSWVIVGGESGPGARPCDVAWIRDLLRQCRESQVPCFTKQLGAWPLVYREEARRLMALGSRVAWDDSGEEISARLVLRDRKGGDPAEWPADLRVREWPR